LTTREEDLESGAIWNFDRVSGRLLDVNQLPFAPQAMSRDGLWLGTHRLYDTKIQIGEARLRKKPRTLPFDGQGMSFAFGPPNTLASASRNEEIKVWNLASGQGRVVHRNTFR
jgi:WD40 repeat protein